MIRNTETAGGRTTQETPPTSTGNPSWIIQHLSNDRPMTPEMQALIEDLVTPLHQDLVQTETDALLRAVGNAVVFAQAIEMLNQPGILAAAKRAFDGQHADWDEYAKRLTPFMKVTKDKANSLRLLLQLRKIQRAELRSIGGPTPGEKNTNAKQVRKFEFP